MSERAQNRIETSALKFARPNIVSTPQSGGGFVLRSADPLGAYPVSIANYLDHWAERDPNRLFLAERSPAGEWRTLTYGVALRQARGVAQALLDRGLSIERPVMVLSGNSIEHAILMLGCFKAGVPIAPVSPAYSLMSGDFSKLRYIAELIRPGMIYAGSMEPFAGALTAIGVKEVELVSAAPSQAFNTSQFADLHAVKPTEAVDRASAAITGDSIAKVLFTSGSTGLPKGVINTHRMLSANQQMVAQCWPFLDEMPPILVDWLPWNHTFGGNYNFNMVLRQGGSIFIDGGKPAPGLIEQTVANLREISPNIYFNVPAGYAMLLPYLERDAELARNFFKNLKLIFYAAAALPQDLWTRLERLSLQFVGRKIAMTSAWGSTETAPLATSAHFPLKRAGVIGVPVPGVELKFVPSGAKMEMRVRGPSVTPGYFRRPDLTAAAFDTDGFYRIGDAGKLADPADPNKGVVFDGRTAEDFKLTTGTWVHVGGLRVAVLAACSPVLQDAVICGQDRDEVCVLAWPNLNACREIVGDRSGTLLPAELCRHERMVETLRMGLRRHNEANPATSTRIARLILLHEPPSIDANEITDKGYINQRAALERRADLVKLLYEDPSHPDIISGD